MKKDFERLSMSGRVIIVTGGGSGIGEATARLLAGRGAGVLVADVDLDQASRVAEEITLDGGRATAHPVDIAIEGEVERMVATAVTEFGGLDGAFNNVGISPKTRAPIHELDREDWDRSVAVNLTGTFFCIKHELRHLIPQGSGSIVNTASAMAVVSMANNSAYVATKHAVLGLTRAASTEASALGVRVNALLPGGIETPMSLAARSALPASDAWKDPHPIGRWGQPHEMAEVVAWLLSDAASFVTGSALAADGGWTSI